MTSWREAQQRGRKGFGMGYVLRLAALALVAAAAGAWGASLREGATADAAPVEPEPEPEVLASVAAGPPSTPPQAFIGPKPSIDVDFTQRVERVLEQGRVALGHVVVMDARSGRILAMVSTDPERFPATRTYPAASLIKVVTAAAALDRDPGVVDRPCRYVGSPWRLTRKRVDPPRRGHQSSFRKALAISNNQCFAQLAVHTLGSEAMVDAIDRFGFLEVPAPGYAPGTVDVSDDVYALGKLGSGLAGTRITPLHAVQLAGVLEDGVLREPLFEAGIPPSRPPRRVMTSELAAELREMLVDTTARGTARSAFRDNRGRPLLGPIKVAGKTGSLSGKNPDGRYEWFAGVAPAEDPEIAVAVVVVNGELWWRNASQISAAVLKAWFCPRKTCR